MGKPHLNEDNLIKYLIKGDASAYTYLVELYYDRLCDYANNLTRNGLNAEDIVQNVIVRMWQRRKKLSQDISVKNYLYKSVYNEFINQHRAHVATTVLEKKYIDGLDTVMDRYDDEQQSRLMAILNKEIELLPKKCKETFLLSKKEGLTYTEIADYQQVSVNTVEKQMGKAFSILRKKLKDDVRGFLFLFFKPIKKNPPAY